MRLGTSLLSTTTRQYSVINYSHITTRPTILTKASTRLTSAAAAFAPRYYCSSSKDSSPSSSPSPPAPSSHKDSAWRKMADEKAIPHYLKQDHDRVFDHNRAWAAAQEQRDPGYFAKLSEGQTPDYLWIGCSDSRIPAEQIAGLAPGEAFVHRNIANLVPNNDLNVMAVLDYAVRHLHVKHIVVCGHYGCGGVKAAMTPKDLGILNPWLRNIRDVYRLHEEELDTIKDEEARYNRLVELNVVEQCRNVVKMAAVQQSYAENTYPIVHGWVFGFHDGLLKDLNVDFESMLAKIQKIYNLTD
ncbi:carbonic anhydrase [Apiospora sp. TS-2023a]